MKQVTIISKKESQSSESAYYTVEIEGATYEVRRSNHLSNLERLCGGQEGNRISQSVFIELASTEFVTNNVVNKFDATEAQLKSTDTILSTFTSKKGNTMYRIERIVDTVTRSNEIEKIAEWMYNNMPLTSNTCKIY